MCGNAYTSTKEQVKTRLASTVHLIGEVTISVANGYNKVLLQQNMQSTTVLVFGGGEGGELFSCPPQTGSSRKLLFLCSYLYACTFHSYCNMSTMTVCTCMKACSNSLDTLNANNFRVL